MTATDRPREWDAATYDALPLPHERWGRRILETLPLQGDERVVDIGAGTGRDTEALLQRLPHGHVVAVDGSEAMLGRLRQRLASVGPDRLTVLQADLREPLVLAEPADVVFSVATLHWLPDHSAVFTSLAAVLRPGGLLTAEWGGAGNLASINALLVDLDLLSVDDSLTFATVDETAQRLTGAGLVDVRVDLVPDPVRLQPGAQLEAFLGTVVLGAVLDPLPQDQRPIVVREVAARLHRPVIDYVRLQASARLPTDEPPPDSSSDCGSVG